jgi:hypothetical protein
MKRLVFGPSTMQNLLLFFLNMKLVNRLKENAPPSKKLDWIVALLSIWFVGGIYTDGWAHNHLSSSLETFFTPWHALLYSGYFAVALAFAIAWCINYRKGYRMLAALPPGYLLGLIGAKIFFLSGLGDLAWHEIFGIEANVDALLSPTHLGLAIGAALMVSSPLRAYLAKARTKLSFVAAIPLLISMAAFWLVLTFMTQYVNPINQPFMIADKITKDPYFGQTIGLAAILLSAITIIGLLSVVVRRQKLPFGSLVVVFTTLDVFFMYTKLDNSGLKMDTSMMPGTPTRLYRMNTICPSEETYLYSTIPFRGVCSACTMDSCGCFYINNV